MDNNFNQEQNNPYTNYAAGNAQNQNMSVAYEVMRQRELENKKGLAIASLVLGIISLICCCTGVFFPLAIVAIVLGTISLVQKKGGKGMAVGGVVTGGIALVLSIVMWISILVSISQMGIQFSDFLDSEELKIKIEEYMEREADRVYEETGKYPEYYYQYHMDEDDWADKYLFTPNGAVKGMNPQGYTYFQE